MSATTHGEEQPSPTERILAEPSRAEASWAERQSQPLPAEHTHRRTRPPRRRAQSPRRRIQLLPSAAQLPQRRTMLAHGTTLPQGPAHRASNEPQAIEAAHPLAGRTGGRHRTAGPPQATFAELFAIREFRALWSAQTLSYAGDQIAQVAIAVLVYARTGSPAITALAYALAYLPPIMGGPLLSGLADLIPRRQAMIILDLVRAGLVTLMALPWMPLALVCTLLFATMLLGPPFAAARTALLPDVVPPDRLVLGFTAGNITFQAGQIAGFLAGGTLVAMLGPRRALALDALSFCLSAAIIVGWVEHRPLPASGPPPARPSLWAITRDGATIVFSHARLRTLVLLGWLAGFAVVPEGLAAPYARTLGGGPLTVGLLMATMPAGMVAGGLVVGRVTTTAQQVRMIGWLAMLSCAPLAGSLLRPPLWALVPLLALAGAAGAYQLAAAAAFVEALPRRARARAFGVAQSGLLAAQGLGILIAGTAAAHLGPQTVVGFAGVFGAVAAAVLASRWASDGSATASGRTGRHDPPAP
jgi:MFS family permease